MKKLFPLLAICAGCVTAPAPNGVPNFKQVVPNIYRGGQPTVAGWQFLKSIGITNIVKLNSGCDCQSGLTEHDLPISFWQQTMTVPDPAKLNAAVLAIGPGTFVHCQHGQDRTGLVIAIYRVKVNGWTKQQAETEMLNDGFHVSLTGLDRAWERVK